VLLLTRLTVLGEVADPPDFKDGHCSPARRRVRQLQIWKIRKIRVRLLRSFSAPGASLWQNAVNEKTTVSSLYTYISNTLLNTTYPGGIMRHDQRGYNNQNIRITQATCYLWVAFFFDLIEISCDKAAMRIIIFNGR
jgi:hypothetical protein